MVVFRCGLPGGPAVSRVEKASKRGADCATTHFQPMAGGHAKGQIQRHDTVKRSCVQWMVTGQSGVSGKNAQEAVGMATKPGPELAVTRRLNTAAGHVRGKRWKPSCVTLGLAQFMECGVFGSLGVRAAKVVEKAVRQEQDFATTHHHHLVEPTAVEQKPRCKSAMRETVQLTASGRLGPVGAPAQCPVAEEPGRERGPALTPHHSMEEASVKGVMSRVIFAIVILVQPMVTGALGAAGVHAAELAMEGRCEDTARVTTHIPPMEEEPAGGQIPRCRGATLTCVLWMEAGEHGIAGATVLSLAEEVKGCGSGYVTIQCHPKVAVPVQEMPLRCPDAIRRHVQVDPSEPEGVLLGILMMWSLESHSLMPQ